MVAYMYEVDGHGHTYHPGVYPREKDLSGIHLECATYTIYLYQPPIPSERWCPPPGVYRPPIPLFL